MRAEDLIDHLNLEPHCEGGYFRRTFQADHREKLVTEHGERFTMTSIYYMLTEQSPIGYFHHDKSDIIHCFHFGDPIDYFLIHPSGELISFTLGSNLKDGEVLQYIVPGGRWKASRLKGSGEHGYGLLSEAVAPGFEYDDMTIGKTPELLARFPEHTDLIMALSRP